MERHIGESRNAWGHSTRAGGYGKSWAFKQLIIRDDRSPANKKSLAGPDYAKESLDNDDALDPPQISRKHGNPGTLGRQFMTIPAPPSDP